MTLKAFLVEDSPVIRENLIESLHEMAPVEVVGTADNEAAAVAWLESADNECDLVIIDIFLKRGSGLGVLRAMHDPHRALVVLSNYLTEPMRGKCRDLGAHAMFDKSNEIDDLLAYCTRLADGQVHADARAPRP